MIVPLIFHKYLDEQGRRFWMSGYYAISEGPKKVKFHEKKKRETGTSARAHMMEVALVSLEADPLKC